MRRLGFVLACLCGLAVNALIYKPVLGYDPNRDFLGLYPGGRLAGSALVYDPPSVMAVQKQAAGVVNPYRLFIRPPFYALLMWPIARLPYRTAFFVYEGLLLAGVVAFLCLWTIPRRALVILACCWSMPLLGSIAIAQDDALLLFLLAAVFLLLKGDRDFRAGLLMSLCAIKPHLFFSLPFFIGARRLWRFAAGLASGAAVLVLLCFAGAGPRALSLFAHTATLTQTNLGIDLMTNLRGLFGGNLAAELSVAAALAVLVWFVSRRSDLEWSWAVMLAAGLLMSHHAYAADCTILIPVLFLVLSRSRSDVQRVLAFWLLTPLAYIWLYLDRGFFTQFPLLLLALSFAIKPREPAIVGARKGSGSFPSGGREISGTGQSDGAFASSGRMPMGSQADLRQH